MAHPPLLQGRFEGRVGTVGPRGVGQTPQLLLGCRAGGASSSPGPDTAAVVDLLRNAA